MIYCTLLRSSQVLHDHRGLSLFWSKTSSNANPSFPMKFDALFVARNCRSWVYLFFYRCMSHFLYKLEDPFHFHIYPQSWRLSGTLDGSFLQRSRTEATRSKAASPSPSSPAAATHCLRGRRPSRCSVGTWAV